MFIKYVDIKHINMYVSQWYTLLQEHNHASTECKYNHKYLWRHFRRPVEGITQIFI